MAYDTVIYRKEGHIAYVTLNRPESANALNATMHRELYEVWEDFKADEDVWIGIVTGAGTRHFCTGADMKEAATAGAKGEQKDLWRHYLPGEGKFGYPGHHEIWKPLIVAINGVCAGGGLHFVCDTDIAICSENATFFDPHVAVGQAVGPEMIGLSRRIPLGIVTRMAFMGTQERMSAQRAYEIGLVSQVVPQGELMATATEIAEKILMNAPLAVRATKAAIRKGLDLGYNEAMYLGHLLIAQVRGTDDQIEGPRAFAEKRKPNWKAR